MARPLLFYVPAAAFAAKTCLGAVATFILCSLTLMACASHAWRWRHAVTGRSRSSNPVISVQQVQPDEGLCLWQRGILMGGKCHLPDFSGVINYDSAGNLVAPGSARLMRMVKQEEQSHPVALCSK